LAHPCLYFGWLRFRALKPHRKPAVDSTVCMSASDSLRSLFFFFLIGTTNHSDEILKCLENIIKSDIFGLEDRNVLSICLDHGLSYILMLTFLNSLR